MKEAMETILAVVGMTLLITIIVSAPYFIHIAHWNYKCDSYGEAFNVSVIYVPWEGCYSRSGGVTTLVIKD